MAERSASREEEGVVGTTRVRPSKLIVWSLCLFQHGWQMRLLIDTSTCALSCRVKVSAGGVDGISYPNDGSACHTPTQDTSMEPSTAVPASTTQLLRET
jgi:hypothetical protein